MTVVHYYNTAASRTKSLDYVIFIYPRRVYKRSEQVKFN